MRRNLFNNCLRSISGGIIGGGLGIYFMSTHGGKLEVSKGL